MRGEAIVLCIVPPLLYRHPSSLRSLRGVKTRRLYGPWRHGATLTALTARTLQSVPVRCMLRTIAAVEMEPPVSQWTLLFTA